MPDGKKYRVKSVTFELGSSHFDFAEQAFRSASFNIKTYIISRQRLAEDQHAKRCRECW